MQKNRRLSGFTLIELVVVIMLIGILLSGSTNLLNQGFKSFFTGKDIINANWQGSIALERLARDLRSVRSNTDITAAAANSITFIDIDGNTITYQVSGGKLQRNTQYLADGVQSITFAYYTGATTPSLLTPLPLTASLRLSIRYIKITLNMSYNNLTFPIITAVYLWTLK
jgi:prepilin-type N-terminal cleavage/methylation domain-containing protein